MNHALQVERALVETLDRRRVETLAKLGLMLSLMAGGEAAEVVGYDAATLYDEVLIALGIEDSEYPDVALEIARDHPEGNILADRFTDACKRSPSPTADFSADQRKAFTELMEEVGTYIFHNNGPRVMPLKQAWNRAFPFAKAAAKRRDTDGSPKGTDAQRQDGEAATAGAEGIAQPSSQDHSS